MNVSHFLCAAVITLVVPIASAQSSDYPGASDFHTIARPANSFIIGALHIDNDEFAIPLGPVEWHADHLGKSLTVTGPIDMLAYAGPKTASSLTTYTSLASQLTTSGYTEVWSCSRKTCGSAFYLATILDKPLRDAALQGDWGFWLNDDLNATNDDIRYGTFRKGAEFMLVMGSLSPGDPSGAMLIRVNGPANNPVLSATTGAAPAQGETAQTNSGNSHGRIRSAAQSLLKKVPQQ